MFQTNVSIKISRSHIQTRKIKSRNSSVNTNSIHNNLIGLLRKVHSSSLHHCQRRVYHSPHHARPPTVPSPHSLSSFIITPSSSLPLHSSFSAQPTCCGCCINCWAAGCFSCKTPFHVYPTSLKKKEDHDKHIVRLPPSSAACWAI